LLLATSPLLLLPCVAQGIVTMNTLTPPQYALLVSCSYPSITRIDPILDLLEELEQCQQQQQQHD
jgi:hypothetical protein